MPILKNKTKCAPQADRYLKRLSLLEKHKQELYRKEITALLNI